jgi:cell division protein FtsQ
MKKNLARISLILLFIFLTTYQANTEKKSKNNIFPIKKIEFINNKIIENNDLLKKLDFLFQENLFLVNKKIIINSLAEFDLILSAKIKKIYPSTLRIIIQEKKLIAIVVKDNKKFYMDDGGNLIKFFSPKKYKSLPNIFGNTEKFYLFYKSLIKINFNITEIDSYYYFDSNRWDILMKNKDLVKLPSYNYEQSLANYKKIKSDLNFANYKIFDYRIKDQLILK